MSTYHNLTVLSWHLNLIPFKGPNKSRQIQDSFKLITEHNPDIICFQGIYSLLSYLRLKKKLESTYPYMSSVPQKNTLKLINSGLVIFSKYPIKNEYFKNYKKQANTSTLITRGFLVCTIQKLNFINTYLPINTDNKNLEPQHDNINQLFNSMKHYNNKNNIYCSYLALPKESEELKKIKDQFKFRDISTDKSFILTTQDSDIKVLKQSKKITTHNNEHKYSPVLSKISYIVTLEEDLHHI